MTRASPGRWRGPISTHNDRGHQHYFSRQVEGADPSETPSEPSAAPSKPADRPGLPKTGADSSTGAIFVMLLVGSAALIARGRK